MSQLSLVALPPLAQPMGTSQPASRLRVRALRLARSLRPRPSTACALLAFLGFLAAEWVLSASHGRAAVAWWTLALGATLLHVAGIVTAAVDLVRERTWRAAAPLLLTAATALVVSRLA